MAKNKPLPTAPRWVQNLRNMMEDQGFNPRSLSLKAGLNPTAVRDMFEGRSRFPRYDTAMALAEALHTTPARLMCDPESPESNEPKAPNFDQDTELLAEIITRLQEVSADKDRKLAPRDFAAMVLTIYRRIRESEDRKKKISTIRPQIHDLLEYEMLRRNRPSAKKTK
ncbi:MAG: helix-turn-helix transcriptional regulator [Bdellovibrionales bacterium]